jgi:excisionase family DNA binding protein
VSEPWKTAREIAEYLGVSTGTVLDWWEAGKLPGVRLVDGPRAPVRFRLSEVEAALETRRRGPRVPAGRLTVLR